MRELATYLPGGRLRRWLASRRRKLQDRRLRKPVPEPEPEPEPSSSPQGSNAHQNSGRIESSSLVNPSNLPSPHENPAASNDRPASLILQDGPLPGIPSSHVPGIPEGGFIETSQTSFHQPSSSSSPQIKPFTRATTFTPRYETMVSIKITTKFRSQIHSETLDLPRLETPEARYKHIESTTKATGERFCRKVPNDLELSLLEGYCFVSCIGGEQCKATELERYTLESLEDWRDVETIVANYERGEGKHQNLLIAITRKLELSRKPGEGVRLPAENINMKDWLCRELEEALQQAKVERSEFYIPRGKIQDFTRRDIVEGVCRVSDCGLVSSPEGRTKLAKTICRKAPILFAISVYEMLPLSLLKRMLDEAMDDESLPLPEECPSWIDSRDRSDTQWIHYRKLYKNQWAFTAAEFYDVGKHQDINANVIIPFLSKEEIARGNFSIVYRIRFESSHQRLCSFPEDPNPEFALKVIDTHRKDTSTAFMNEQLILKGLQEMTDDHIIKLLGTYQQGGNYHFLFPLAECSLEKYMQEDPRHFSAPTSMASRQFVVWVIDQFRGMASGLAKIHVRSDRPKIDTKGSSSLKPPEPILLHPDVAKSQPSAGTGYHHDIKPQNILLFMKLSDVLTVPIYGILQIADFGIGKFHSLKSGTGTNTIRGTPTYAAPESKIPRKPSSNGNLDSRPVLTVSRPYDVWSLGCVLMEILVWLVFGAKGWREFNESRAGFEDESDESYTTDGFFVVTARKEARVRKTVIDWQEKLRAHDRLKESSGSILLGLLNIVEKVLDVNPETRITAEDLSKELADLMKLDDTVETLSTIAKYPSNNDTYPPSRMSTPPIVVKTPGEASSITTSGSNSPEKKQRISTESKASVGQTGIRTNARVHPSTARVPQSPTTSSRFPLPSRRGTANTMQSSRPESLSSLAVEKFSSYPQE